jgi:tetratricopeptide (TPR) repeat protein
MAKNPAVLILAGIALGFIIGFLTANSVNRTEINGLRAQLESAQAVASTAAGDQNDDASLSPEEIREKVAEADQNPTNAAFQKNLGLGLYRYGALKNDPEIIGESARLLERAAAFLPNDQDVTVGLGNAWFDIGYMKKDNDALAKAREAYQRSLGKNANDVDVQTDLAMTYFLQTPPDDKKAVEEFKRALAADPKNEKALEFVVQSLDRLGNKAEAGKYLEQLRQAHPSNRSISGLTTQIQQTNTAK